jgi:Protein of unknown function (DUF1592)/Protein of unknown function (DUF1588)/Protein of unknown function (DUF1587)/Protein of unknown function (DUF1585)/Protein of unknown function (DUF1595)
MEIILKYLKSCSHTGSVLTVGLFSTLVVAASPPGPAYRPVTVQTDGAVEFRQEIQPLLKKYCYSCHASGVKSGNVALDEIKSDAGLRQDRKLFQKVLKNLRSGIMPPAGMNQPAEAEKHRIEQWIKTHVYRIDPANPDPGRVTVRRLNRVEYRNTVRDLVGVDYDTQTEFPPDDAGHGFDNISDVLTVSPMLMEKYLNAAQAIIAQAVPTTSKVVAETEISGASFVREDAGVPADKASDFRALSYYEPATVSHTLQIEHPGGYQLILDLSANEHYVDNKFDYNRCRLIVRAGGQELLRKDYNREGGKSLHYVFDQKWQVGGHNLSFEVQPLTPGVEQIRSLTLRIHKVTLRGPLDAKYAVEPRNYRTFFPKPVPSGNPARRAYARELLGNFARKAFRRPVDGNTLARLSALAEGVYTQPDQTFEAGVAQAMMAVLASPRFLFREEGIATEQGSHLYAPLDEYALASRLSYFLWSSMPDDELFRLAYQGQLRQNLPAQVRRMLRDRRSEALIQNFSGQWLQTRDIEKVPINPFAVLRREIDPAASAGARGGSFRFGNRPRVFFDEALRKDLRREVDFYFGHVVREDRSVLELLDSNYTFLNGRLAQYYSLTDLGVSGDEFRMVTLPSGSPRGGILTMGSVLAVTSNPTRTSPVKRGLFVLDNILGSPPPPPPPNIPPLEAAGTGLKNSNPTLREVLSAHRSKPECQSCHQRLDPPGLALENFNAMGLWRDREFGQPIEPGGTLVTGESFKDIRELKHILVSRHSTEFYRCLTEKLLTYALGRGLEDYDVESVDRIVKRLQQDKGRFSSLLAGVIESAPFQKRRNAPAAAIVNTPRQASSLSKGKAAPKKST